MSRKLLVGYSMTSTHVQTTLDYLRALKSDLGYDTTYIHATHDAKIDFDLAAAGYDIVFNNYCTRFCFDGYVSQSYRDALRRFPGLKVMAVQDEYDHTNRLKAAIKDCGFHIVLTCVPQDSLEYVYPRAEFPDVEFITVFTGYVPDGFAQSLPPAKPLADRKIVLGYRGRDIGPRYGRLGFEKYEIGRRMKEICDAQGVVNDIAMDEASRIYGTAWFDFVGDCRGMLGSESGSNVFDFDGSIAVALEQMKKSLGRLPTHSEFKSIVGKRDTEIDMGQISPRVFECAVMRTPMVLFRGRYSDAIEPDAHYIPLELDFSNADEVLRRLEDLPALEAMSRRAYEHLVESGNFGYKTNFGRLKTRFEDRLARLSWKRDALDAGLEVQEITDERHIILRQEPTLEPGNMAAFQSIQLRLAGVDTKKHSRQIDQVYANAMRDALASARSLNKLLTKSILTVGKIDAASEYGTQSRADHGSCSFVALQQSFDVIMKERDNAERKRDCLVRATADAKAARMSVVEHDSLKRLAEHDQLWIATYSGKYEAFYTEYTQCTAKLQESIATNGRLLEEAASHDKDPL